MTLRIDPSKPPVRAHTYYACVRCGLINDEYEAFAAGRLGRERHYCLAHIPWQARLRLHWNEWRQS
jgi:hypothetical protein